MQIFTSIVAALALATPIYGYNKRCNRYNASATSINDIQCAKSTTHDECNNFCNGFKDRLRAISLKHSQPAPGDPWGSSFMELDPAHSACNGETGLDPTTTPCTCTVRLMRGRSYLMPVSEEEDDPSWDMDNVQWDKTFSLIDQKNVRCGN